MDDLFESHIANCQRRSAQRMLDDFEDAGIDEDLEQLKAGWAPSFSRRPGFVPPRQPAAPKTIARALCAVPGETKQSSTKICTKPGEPRRGATRPKCNGSGVFALADDTPAHDTCQEDPEYVSTLAIQAELARDRLQQIGALRQIAASPIAGETPNATSSQPASRKAPFLRHLAANPINADDPWDAWESRWSQEFQQFDEFERAKHGRRIAEADAENSRREAQWRQKVEHAKSQADKAGHRRHDSQPHAKHTTEPPRSSSSQEGSRKPEEQHRPKQPQRPPPEPPKSGTSAKEQHARREQQGSSGRVPKRPQWERPTGAASEDQGARKDQQFPGASASSPPGVPPRVRVAPQGPKEVSFSSYSDFDAAWSRFEGQVSSGQALRYTDVPWPTSLPSISGACGTHDAAERKRKLRTALVRWHPDKWGVIFGLIHEDDKQIVMEKVKDVTRRIIEEKRVFGG